MGWCLHFFHKFLYDRSNWPPLPQVFFYFLSNFDFFLFALLTYVHDMSASKLLRQLFFRPDQRKWIDEFSTRLYFKSFQFK